jgi:hypothetical protein
MISGTRSVAGVPAAQKQPKDRQQRRRQRRKRQSPDGDDAHREVDSHREVDALGKQDDAMVIDIKGRGKHLANTPSSSPSKERQASQHPGRKPRYVDIRV